MAIVVAPDGPCDLLSTKILFDAFCRMRQRIFRNNEFAR